MFSVLLSWRLSTLWSRRSFSKRGWVCQGRSIPCLSIHSAFHIIIPHFFPATLFPLSQRLCRWRYGIKFSPNKPASPHLNGKVKRSQKIDKIEFYSIINLASADLHMLLAEWQQHYDNGDRSHSAHKGKTPMEQYCELMDQTPLSEEVANGYLPKRGHIQERNYRLKLQLRKLKRCL